MELPSASRQVFPAAPLDVHGYFGLVVVAVVLVAASLMAVKAGALEGPGAIPFGILGLVWAMSRWSPRCYLITEGWLRIQRRWPVGQAEIPLRGVDKVERPVGLTPYNCWRLYAGDFFGYYGYFWKRGLGTFWMSATNFEHLVLIADGRRRVVISPREPASFIAALRQALEQESARAATAAS